MNSYSVLLGEQHFALIVQELLAITKVMNETKRVEIKEILRE
jgi:hypothetical protein